MLLFFGATKTVVLERTAEPFQSVSTASELSFSVPEPRAPALADARVIEPTPVDNVGVFPVAQTRAAVVSTRFNRGRTVFVAGALTRESTTDMESVGFVAKYDNVTVAADAVSEV